ncbi:MAG: transglycosylase SLT domain-containing protein [Verrucomicrobia bacterium]|nr:transglycosylase SLT domain-containing protein [Verrucomicrobiota bacterium]
MRQKHIERLLDVLVPALALLVLALAVIWLKPPVRPDFIPPDAVWDFVQKEAGRQGLDPYFVYAIVFAESSLNANADSGVARGIMQIKRGAWGQMTDRPYLQAWQWQINIRVGVSYLAWLAGRLHQQDKFSYPLLAASYHHGFGAVRAANFQINRLPATNNKVYQQIYAGIIPAALVGHPGPPKLPVQESRLASP